MIGDSSRIGPSTLQPIGNVKHSGVCATGTDHLNTERQAFGSLRERDVNARRVQQCPDAIKNGVTGRIESSRRRARSARHEQRIAAGAREERRKLAPAGARDFERGIVVRRRQALTFLQHGCEPQA